MIDVAGVFGDNLVRQRKLAAIPQEELAIRASLHRTEVSQLERGLRVARIDTLVKLVGSLECDACDLLVGLDWSPGGVRFGSFKDPQSQESQSQQSVRSQ